MSGMTQHGAGLMHNIFLRDRGVLVELSIDGSGGLRHFHNLARWYGRVYQGIDCSNPVSISDVISRMVNIVENIDLNSY